MSLDGFVERFKDLKKRSFEVSLKIGKIADREAKEQDETRKPRVYKMETDESDDQPVKDSVERRREKLMGYTMREYENWEKKVQEKEIRKDGANLQELANLTYKKQLGKIKKQTGPSHGARVSKDQETGKLKVRDDAQLVNRLAKDLKRTSDERFLARKREMEKRSMRETPGGYVNDKNKQFNEKLDREIKDAER